jgi:hypothetical protein
MQKDQERDYLRNNLQARSLKDRNMYENVLQQKA